MATVTGADSVTVKKGDTALTVTTDYTYTRSNGKLTIKSSYLAAQDNGSVALTITDEDGETGTLTVTVGD